jgi:hypothetical protein
MVIVGGEILTAEANLATDPWPIGVGVFDLSDMIWKDSYDPSAASYVTPQPIKDYIESNGRFPAAWSDPTVKSWFTMKGKWMFNNGMLDRLLTGCIDRICQWSITILVFRQFDQFDRCRRNRRCHSGCRCWYCSCRGIVLVCSAET